jgi:hypothetical protein
LAGAGLVAISTPATITNAAVAVSPICVSWPIVGDGVRVPISRRRRAACAAALRHACG